MHQSVLGVSVTSTAATLGVLRETEPSLETAVVGILQNVLLRFPQIQNVSVRFVLSEHSFFRCSPIFLVLFSILLH